MAVDAAGTQSNTNSNTHSNTGAQSGGLINVIGAAMSLALVIGVSVWAYKTITRDVSGVPVIKAAEGPMRVQPDTPGGAIADHQGLSVNNVAAQGTASAPADRLILAPAPLDLTQEDVAPAPTAEQTPTQEINAEAGDAPATDPEVLQRAAVEALANSLADGVDPITPLSDDQVQAPARVTSPEADPLAEAELASVPLDAPVTGGLGRSLRPKLRPSGLGSLPGATPTAAGPVTDVDPDSLPVGTRLAQLGAFASADIARSEWERLSSQFGDYLSGKSRVIQKAQSGGRTFYRLRAAGFDDLSDARRFCSALVAERAECIPVVTR
ncbi:MAG: SPOR domain-containing protein [Pseudomonadota bacterium]